MNEATKYNDDDRKTKKDKKSERNKVKISFRLLTVDGDGVCSIWLMYLFFMLKSVRIVWFNFSQISVPMCHMEKTRKNKSPNTPEKNLSQTTATNKQNESNSTTCNQKHRTNVISLTWLLVGFGLLLLLLYDCCLSYVRVCLCVRILLSISYAAGVVIC